MRVLDNGVAVCGQSHHAQWCATEGLEHDRFFVRFLERLVIGRGIKRVIQVGAHIGTLTQGLLDLDCAVFAFEPNPDAVECLAHNCHGGKLTISNKAVGDRFGRATLHLDENAGASWLEQHQGYLNGGEVSVVVLNNKSSGVDLILADCEGWEPKVLRGAQEYIARCRPALVLEVNAGALERVGESRAGLLALVDELGYLREVIQPGLAWDAPQYDILCLPK